MTEATVRTAEIDDAVDALRHEAVAWHPMIVLTDGRLAGRFREALHAAGREDALRVVHVSGRRLRSMPVDERSRRPDPGLGLDEMTVEAAPFHMGLPTLGEDEATGRDAAVMLLAPPGDPCVGYARWLHRRAWARARREGRDGPLMITDRPGTRDVVTQSAGDWDGVLRVVSDDDFPLAAIGPRARVEAAVDGPAARSGWVRGADGRHPCRAVGAWRVIDGSDRIVLATDRPAAVEDAPEGRGDDWRDVTVAEIRSDGICLCARWTIPASDVDLGHLARVAWRGGIVRLEGAVWQTVTGVTLFPEPGKFILRMLGAEPGMEGIAARVAGWVDQPVEAALRFHRHAGEVRHMLARDPGPARARRDFVLAWPAFAGMLLEEGVRARIDAGERTLPLVVAEMGATPAVARRLVGITRLGESPDDPNRGPIVDPRRYGRLVTAFGHDRLPDAGDVSGWWTFHKVLALGVEAYRGHAGLTAGELARLCLAVPGRDWEARWMALADGTRTQSGVTEIRDTARAMQRWLADMSGEDIHFRVPLRLLSAHRSLLALARASDAWHAQPALQAPPRGLPDGCAWPVPFDPVDLGAGWTAVALGDVRALRDEGGEGPDASGMAGLSHCVGGYGPECQSGRSLVVSLRAGGPGGTERRSTLELVPGDGDWRIGGKTYRLRQHRGRRNAVPAAECGLAMHRLRRRLEAGEIPVRTEALALRKAAEAIVDPAAAATALRGWRRVLPARYARLDADALVAEALAPDPREAAAAGA